LQPPHFAIAKGLPRISVPWGIVQWCILLETGHPLAALDRSQEANRKTLTTWRAATAAAMIG
jgi:hypothetical protein